MVMTPRELVISVSWVSVIIAKAYNRLLAFKMDILLEAHILTLFRILVVNTKAKRHRKCE